MLAEEGDDLSSIKTPSNLAPEGQGGEEASAESSGSGSGTGSQKEEPKQETKSETTPPPAPSKEAPKNHGHKVVKHSKPLFPSVSRL